LLFFGSMKTSTEFCRSLALSTGFDRKSRGRSVRRPPSSNLAGGLLALLLAGCGGGAPSAGSGEAGSTAAAAGAAGAAPMGSSAGAGETLPPEPVPPGSETNHLDVTPVLDPSKAVKHAYDFINGTSLIAIDANGAVYSLSIPPFAIARSVEITMTPISSLMSPEAGVGPVLGVQIEPHGLLLLQPARLTITAPAALGKTDLSPFSYLGAGESLHPRPELVDQGRVMFDLYHFSGYGLQVRTAKLFEAVAQNLEAYYLEQLTAAAEDKDATGAAFQQPLDDYWTLVMQPRLKQPFAGCEQAKSNLTKFFGWARTASMLGISVDPQYQEGLGLVMDGTEACAKATVAACDDPGEAGQTARNELFGFERQAALVSPDRTDAMHDLLEQCWKKTCATPGFRNKNEVVAMIACDPEPTAGKVEIEITMNYKTSLDAKYGAEANGKSTRTIEATYNETISIDVGSVLTFPGPGMKTVLLASMLEEQANSHGLETFVASAPCITGEAGQILQEDETSRKENRAAGTVPSRFAALMASVDASGNIIWDLNPPPFDLTGAAWAEGMHVNPCANPANGNDPVNDPGASTPAPAPVKMKRLLPYRMPSAMPALRIDAGKGGPVMGESDTPITIAGHPGNAHMKWNLVFPLLP
jgi:hypothetical protein